MRKHKLQLQFPWLSYPQKTLFTCWSLFSLIDFVFEQNAILKDLVTGIFPEEIQCWSPECTFHPFLVPILLWKGSLRNYVIFVLVKGKTHCCARRTHLSKLEFNWGNQQRWWIVPLQVFSDVVLNPETQFQISFAATVLINIKVYHEKNDETNLGENIEIMY